MQPIDELIDRVKDLPPAPQILPQLLPLLSQGDVDTDRVVRLLTYDPGLTANLLRLSNAAYFGNSRPAEDVSEAITRLGFRKVYELVVAIVGSSVLAGAQRGYGMMAGELWQHSVSSAVAAQLIARDLGDDESATFTGGLLHDVGKLVLSEVLTDKYEEMLFETEQHERSMLETEKAIVGFEHTEIGGRLLERWNLPLPLMTAVRCHHAPSEAGEHQRLAAMVYLGNMVAHCMGFSSGYLSFALRGRAEVFQILALDPDKWPIYLVRTWEELERIRTLLKLKS